MLYRGGTGTNGGGAGLPGIAANFTEVTGVVAAIEGAAAPLLLPEPAVVEGGSAVRICSTAAICERRAVRLWMSALS